MAHTYEELRKLSVAELVRQHDYHAKNTMVGISYYLEEVGRRDNARIARQMFWMTVVITVCTVVMAILTGVLVSRTPVAG
jgi:hypothetical protein